MYPFGADLHTTALLSISATILLLLPYSITPNMAVFLICVKVRLTRTAEACVLQTTMTTAALITEWPKLS